MIDRSPWDEADLKVKSLIYLSLETEGCRTFHQRNPHTRIERCTTNELVHELSLTFTRPRNLTFDRFQLFRALQQSNETLETVFSRLRELGSHAKLEHLEEDLVKDLLFISNMHSSNTQMELLSEVRTPQQVLNYAINRERGQANQQEIIKLEKCPDDLFISPVVITVKKDKSVKIALDSKKLNDALHRNKYQMQSIDHLVDSVALYISERRNLPG